MPTCGREPISEKVKKGIAKVLRTYGQFVGRYPLPFILVPIALFGGLAGGIYKIELEDDPEVLYYPRDNQAKKDMKKLEDIGFRTAFSHYSKFSVVSSIQEANLIYKVKDSSRSIFDDEVAKEINESLTEIGYDIYTQVWTCATVRGVCVENGAMTISSEFRTLVKSKNVTFPTWTDPRDGVKKDLSAYLAEVKTEGEGEGETKVLLSAGVLRVTLPGYGSFYEYFLELAARLRLSYTDVFYATLTSLGDELTIAVQGDITLFVGTVLLVVSYSCLVTVGGDIVSTRALLATGGVCATALGIAGAVGLLCVIGNDFALINSVVPFLLIGIGVDDMFLLMSSWSESLDNEDIPVPQRVGVTMAFAGLGMTVTSLTDFLAFMIGYSSVFFSVRSFCLYAGVGVLCVYICHMTFFTACLSLHGRRVYSERHCLTCRKAKPRQQLQEEGKPWLYRFLCGGHPPHRPRDDESWCEKYPRILIPRFVGIKAVHYAVPFVFAALLAVSIYGAVNIEQGLHFKDLVLSSSYYHDYIIAKEQYFPDRIAIGFHMVGDVDYSDAKVQDQVRDLLTAAKADQAIDGDVEHCWLTSFLNSTYYQNNNLPSEVLFFLGDNPVFLPDIQNKESKIVASRCSVLSVPLSKQYDQADLMVRMRQVAENSPLEIIVFQKDFELYEQYLATMPATLQTVGFAVLAIFVVCCFLLPHPFMVCLTTLNIVMIIFNIFGFMYFWGINLSSITMIHLVMSVGFSVDFSAHVCSAYLMSESLTRADRAYDAITHAASPILNGGMSSLVGVLLLAFSEAYIFSTFFKIMLLVMVFGILNSCVFVPVVLTLLGPEHHGGRVAENADNGAANPHLGENGMAGHHVQNGGENPHLGENGMAGHHAQNGGVRINGHLPGSPPQSTASNASVPQTGSPGLKTISVSEAGQPSESNQMSVRAFKDEIDKLGKSSESSASVNNRGGEAVADATSTGVDENAL